MPDVSPLSLHFLEPPDLGGRPAAVQVLDVAQHVLLAFGTSLLVGVERPTLGEELVVDFVQRDPLGLAAHVAKDPVRVGAELAVEAALLPRALEAARGNLLNVNVRHGLRGRVGRQGRRDKLLDLERDRRQGNRLPEEERDALEGETRLDAIRELGVLNNK